MLVLLLFSISCSDDLEINDLQNKEKVNLEKIGLVNGRMYFPNKATFQNYYAKLREENEEKIAEVLQDRFYSKGFFSFKPIVHSRNEEFELDRHINGIKSNTSGLHQSSLSIQDDFLDDFDDLEDVFGEEVFASFLNQEAELQVENKVYKYTDTGLFIVNVDKVDHLNDFLAFNQISTNFLDPTPEPIRIAFLNNHNPCGGLELIHDEVDDIEHFIPTDDFYDNIPCGDWGGGTANPPKGGVENQPTPTNELALIASKLEFCEGSRPFFGNIFGKTVVCKDRYERKRRVKFKYYNVDLFLAYAVGVKTKHQKRTSIGLWKRTKADEIAMGINSLTWKFNTPSAMPSNSVFNLKPARIYFNDGSMYETDNYFKNPEYITNATMPNLPFNNQIDFIVEAAINLPFSPFENEQDVTKFFWDQIAETVDALYKSQRNRHFKKIGVVISTQSATWIQLYDLSNSCTDCSRRHNLIDFGIATPQFNYTFGNGNSAGLQVKSWSFDFRVPKVVGMSGYGMARIGSNWYGRRMSF